jgi:putative endonuclease
MFFTYIIESDKSGMWYYGHSENVGRRVIEHNSGNNKSTKNKGPWKLIFVKEFESKIAANRFELLLKSHKNKEYVRKEYREFFIGV